MLLLVLGLCGEARSVNLLYTVYYKTYYTTGIKSESEYIKYKNNNGLGLYIKHQVKNK